MLYICTRRLLLHEWAHAVAWPNPWVFTRSQLAINLPCSKRVSAQALPSWRSHYGCQLDAVCSLAWPGADGFSIVCSPFGSAPLFRRVDFPACLTLEIDQVDCFKSIFALGWNLKRDFYHAALFTIYIYLHYVFLYFSIIFPHTSGRLPGAFDFSDKTPFSLGGPRGSVARVLGANLGSTSQEARSPVFTLIPFRSGVIWTGNHNIRPFVSLCAYRFRGSLSCIPW